MSLQSRFDSLQTRHDTLEERLGAETRRPLPDPEQVGKLKREKLRLKEEMERLRGQPAAH